MPFVVPLDCPSCHKKTYYIDLHVEITEDGVYCRKLHLVCSTCGKPENVTIKFQLTKPYFTTDVKRDRKMKAVGVYDG